jgi:5-methylcytosine-specific restriction enzyme subunit McrC
LKHVRGLSLKRPIEIKEFESVICNKNYADIDSFSCIDKNQFEKLKQFIQEYTTSEEDSDALDFMRIGYRRGIGDVVTFKNYVGLIQFDNGFQIQVLPKIDFSTGDDIGNEATKKLFLKMLRSLKDFPSKVFNDASLHVDQMNLYEIFINMYIQEVRQLIKHGLRSAYIEQEDNLKYYKGKLLVSKHVRMNLAHKERFYVGFEEFHQNRPENRLIKSTLIKLRDITSSAENAKEIRQLLMFFEMVEESVSYEKDFSKVVINRNTEDYDNLMKWSKVFLLNKSFTTFSGTSTARALLFPMESVYESYVTKQIKQVFSPYGWEVSGQDRGKYLFTEPRRFALRPDIVLRHGNRTVIMDTKWKSLIPNEGINYGISQSDMYQMYAYSKRYYTPEVWLLFPKSREMQEINNIVFKSEADKESEEGTIVHIWFIDLPNVLNNLELLREELTLSQQIIGVRNGEMTENG